MMRIKKGQGVGSSCRCEVSYCEVNKRESSLRMRPSLAGRDDQVEEVQVTPRMIFSVGVPFFGSLD